MTYDYLNKHQLNSDEQIHYLVITFHSLDMLLLGIRYAALTLLE